ncbi:MAG: spore maturation protein A [Oscillospiraceae bacterium]|nr:spore maturation protein A [Oscillospiraceae bacterium]
MTMAWIWGVLVAASTVVGIVTGNGEGLGTAAVEGAKSAVTLVMGIGGVTCLWTGVMEILERSGLSAGLARITRPVISVIFPDSIGEDAEKNISANMSANLLGLGNAATPLGIAAAKELSEGDAATDNLCTLVVLNTASIQLIPTTAAALRASFGAASPFDIIPAVWFTSAISVTAGLAAAGLFRKLWRG